jgi:hypothetical protein
MLYILRGWCKKKYQTFLVYSHDHNNYPPYADLEMKNWIYWSESNLLIYFYVVLKKNYWSEQSFIGLGPEYQCSSWGLGHGHCNYPPYEWISCHLNKKYRKLWSHVHVYSMFFYRNIFLYMYATNVYLKKFLISLFKNIKLLKYLICM